MLFLGVVLSGQGVARAEEVAILKSAEIGAYSEAISAFKSSLPASFHINLEYDLQGDMAKGRSLARRIRASDASLVLAVGLKAALAAKLEILDIPVIMCLVLDPQKYDLPASNMVGLSLTIPFEKHFEPLRALVPQISTIGVLFDPNKTQGLYDQLQRDVTARGLTLVSQEVHSEQEVSQVLQILDKDIDALWLLPDSTVLTENTLDFLISSTLEANIPLVGFSAGLVRSGATTGAFLRYADLGHHAASVATTLLTSTAGRVLGTLISPEKIRTAINLRSASYLGLSPQPKTLRLYDEQY